MLLSTFPWLVFPAHEQPTPVSEDEVEEKAAADDEQAQSEEDNEGLATFAQSSSQETNPHSSPAKMSTVPSTPTFPFK